MLLSFWLILLWKWHSWKLTNTTFFLTQLRLSAHARLFRDFGDKRPFLCFHSPSLYDRFCYFFFCSSLCVYQPRVESELRHFVNPTFLKLPNIKYVLDGTQKWDLFCKHFEGRSDILEVVRLHFFFWSATTCTQAKVVCLFCSTKGARRQLLYQFYMFIYQSSYVHTTLSDVHLSDSFQLKVEMWLLVFHVKNFCIHASFYNRFKLACMFKVHE